MVDQDITKLHKHIRNAWIAGCISASITFLVSVGSIISPDIAASTGIDAWSIVDALLVAGLSFGIYHESRFCALGLLVYFVIAKIIMAIDADNFKIVAQGLIFIYFFFRGTVAAFQLWKYKVETGLVRVPDRRRLYYVTASIVGVLMIALIAIFVVAALGPEDAVVPGKQLKARYVRELQGLHLLDKNEELTYFYSDAFYSIRKGLYFFTDKKVVLYNEDWGSASIIVPYGAITSIELIDGPEAEKRQINIYQRANTVLNIPMPDKGTDYKTFYELLVRNWKQFK
jgi:hypothetical protein